MRHTLTFSRTPLRMRRRAMAPAATTRWMRIATAAALVAAGLLGARPAAAQAVEGRVLDAQTLEPVPGAAVQLVDSAGQPAGAGVTDSQGIFRVDAPAAGEYRLKAERLGLRATITRPVPLAAGQVVGVEVRMAPEPVALESMAAVGARQRGIVGRVLDDDTGQPIAGATVTLLNVREQRAGRVVSDAWGYFHLNVNRPGGYHLRAERLGYRASTSSPITVTPSDSVEVELRLSTGAVVLAPLTVVAASHQVMRDHQLAGFEWRRTRQPFGRYLGPEEIERLRPFHASDVLQNIGWVRVDGTFDRVVTLPMRGTSRGSGRCVPNLYVDGHRVRLGDGFTVDGLVSGSSVAAVEVYDSPMLAPGEFPALDNEYCGVVVIWTRVPGTTNRGR